LKPIKYVWTHEFIIPKKGSDLWKVIGNEFIILKISTWKENTNIHLPFPVQTWPVVNQIVYVGKHLFIKMFQLINEREMIELEYPLPHNKSVDLVLSISADITNTENQILCALWWKNTPWPIVLPKRTEPEPIQTSGSMCQYPEERGMCWIAPWVHNQQNTDCGKLYRPRDQVL